MKTMLMLASVTFAVFALVTPPQAHRAPPVTIEGPTPVECPSERDWARCVWEGNHGG